MNSSVSFIALNIKYSAQSPCSLLVIKLEEACVGGDVLSLEIEKSTIVSGINLVSSLSSLKYVIYDSLNWNYKWQLLFKQSWHHLDQVTGAGTVVQLVGDEFIPAEFDRANRAGQDKNISAIGNAG